MKDCWKPMLVWVVVLGAQVVKAGPFVMPPWRRSSLNHPAMRAMMNPISGPISLDTRRGSFDSAMFSDLEDILDMAPTIATRKKFVQNEYDIFCREPRYYFTLPDECWFPGFYNKEKNDSTNNAIMDKFKDNYGKPDPTPPPKGNKDPPGNKEPGQEHKKRVSDTDIFRNPDPIQPDPTDPEGCGNPVCVVIDKRPFRFASMCKLIRYLKYERRSKQMNFVQKGDCYEIIAETDDGTTWTNPPQNDEFDCTACSKDIYCKEPVVLNVDLYSILYGESSGYGGQKFNELQRNLTKSARMAGIPLDFENMCKAMNFVNKRPNLNKKTNVFGLYVGKIDNLITPAGATEQGYLWTEWFDLDTPCDSEGDIESYSAHKTYEEATYAEAMRLCGASGILDTEVVGGNGLLYHRIEDIAAGKVKGLNNQTISQKIYHDKYRVTCYNNEQTGQLPAPYLHRPEQAEFDETLELTGREIDTCLDYKIRYKCNSRDMLRPMEIKEFGQQLQIEYPVGALAQTQFNLDSEGFPIIGKNAFVLTYTNPQGEIKKIVFDLTKIPTDFEDSVAASVTGHYFEGDKLRGEFGGDVLFHRKPDDTIQMKLNVTTQRLTIATLDAIISTDNPLNTALFETVTTKIFTTVKKTSERRFTWRCVTTFKTQVKYPDDGSGGSGDNTGGSGRNPGRSEENSKGSGDSGENTPGSGENGSGGSGGNLGGNSKGSGGSGGKPGGNSKGSGGSGGKPGGSGSSGENSKGSGDSGENGSGGSGGDSGENPYPPGTLNEPEKICTCDTKFYGPDSTLIQQIICKYNNPFSTNHNETEPSLHEDPTFIQIVPLPPGKTFDERLRELLNSINIKVVIESPPTENLFSECEWKDWMSNDYPSRLYEGAEFELKQMIASDPNAYAKLSKHICGKDSQNALMIDAVTRETLIPWREMRYGENNEHMVSHYKVNPYFGYSCMDRNMNTKWGCQDMKVRYCCLKKKVASWTNWNQWSKCSVSCGGGKQKRTRKLESCADCVTKGVNLDERFTKQARPCNVNNCPVDFTWTEWTPFGDCSKTCGQGGYKMRTRECIPAAHGGEPCPDKEDKDSLALYQEEEPCTKADCLEYVYTNWSPWSQCSKTCGKGTKIKTRNCQEKNTLQKAENHFCQTVQEGNLFEIKEDCQLTYCAIDGGWTDWTKWGECSQNCRAEGASEGEIGETLAHRKRYKYCTNPMAQHGGKDCSRQEGKNIKYDFTQNALVEKGDCESDLPFCPENCKFSEWSEWSECSSTCFESGPAKLWNVREDGYEEELSKKDLENMYIQLTNEDGAKPTRTRVRFELSPAKHGGTCQWNTGVECINQTSGPPVNMLQEIGDCTVWEKHTNPDHHPFEFTKFPPTEFPIKNEDKRVVGFCPIDCEWGPWEQTFDCKKSQEEKLGYEGCWFPRTLEYMTKFKQDKHFHANFKTVFEALKVAKGDQDNDHRLPKLKGKCLSRGSHRNQKCKRGYSMKFRKLETLWRDDLYDMKEISMSEHQRSAKLPVLDGLFGGKACTMDNGVQLTAFPVPDGDNSKIQSQTETQTVDCAWEFCPQIEGVLAERGSTTTTTTPKPIDHTNHPSCQKYGVWSKWDKWGKCDGKCGVHSFKTRKRRCEKKPWCRVEGEDNLHKECLPGRSSNREVTDTEVTRCAFCPKSDIPTWTQWTSWSFDKTCGNSKQYRTRECLDRNGNPVGITKVGGESIGGCMTRAGIPKESDMQVIHFIGAKECEFYHRH